MKLAIQCALLSRRGGGLPAAVLSAAARLTGRHQTTIPTLDPPEEAPPGAEVVRLTGRGPLVAGACHMLRDLAPDIVHTHGLWTGLSLAALRYRRRTGVPTVVSPHGMLDPWALAQSSRRKRAALALFERAHLSAATIHALTLAEAEVVRALLPGARIAVIPNGVDTAPAEALPRPAFMDRPTLLFLGRLHAKKGVAELITAFAAAAPRLAGWRLAIAGWDDGANDLRAQAAATGADIVFPGPLFGTAKQAAYAHAAAFVLPSFSEGLPMTVLEAWAAGTPVLMTDACNLPEGFAAGAAARVTTDRDELADALAQRLPDDTWRASAGALGRALVAERFGWDRVAADFEALYAHLTGNAPAPAFLT
ncbi:glycosyltransferase [Acuticoccus yangtzensis]|uniref:glycosyltransferase n=1 Tax=Acuticoccus yangtzensis TaxID=1443441 RepID=UPI0009496CE9|nr:glycosyltransferase [Acuticoccus yangtzensis]